jgi:hypothetical protein
VPERVCVSEHDQVKGRVRMGKRTGEGKGLRVGWGYAHSDDD